VQFVLYRTNYLKTLSRASKVLAGRCFPIIKLFGHTLTEWVVACQLTGVTSKKGSHKLCKVCLRVAIQADSAQLKRETRVVSQCGLAIYIKRYLRPKKNYENNFTIQKYSLQNSPLKVTKILQDIITL
jgi:hypothetical protein